MITRRTLLIAILSLATLGGCGQHTATTATDTVAADGAPTGWPHITSAVRRDPAMEARVQHIVAGMSLAQKIGQMTQAERSEEHTSELQSLMRISYAVFCLKKKIHHTTSDHDKTQHE